MQTTSYLPVTLKQAQKELCGDRPYYKHGKKTNRKNIFWKIKQAFKMPPLECPVCWGPTVRIGDFIWTQRDKYHIHERPIISEDLGNEKTEMPMSALIRLKEAKEKDVFEKFQIWRPATKDEAERLTLDPWLVGIIQGQAFKICDWR